jgi:hypothetical protein
MIFAMRTRRSSDEIDSPFFDTVDGCNHSSAVNPRSVDLEVTVEAQAAQIHLKSLTGV